MPFINISRLHSTTVNFWINMNSNLFFYFTKIFGLSYLGISATTHTRKQCSWKIHADGNDQYVWPQNEDFLTELI